MTNPELNENPSEVSATATCQIDGCDGAKYDSVTWSTPINRAGKVLPSGINPKVLSVCVGHYWSLTTAMYGSD